MALVTVTANATNNSGNAGAFSYMSFAASGVAASDVRSFSFDTAGNSTSLSIQASGTFLATGLTPGSNTFTAKYRVSSGTGTWLNRSIVVVPLP
jgi:hypothetical protein